MFSLKCYWCNSSDLQTKRFTCCWFSVIIKLQYWIFFHYLYFPVSHDTLMYWQFPSPPPKINFSNLNYMLLYCINFIWLPFKMDIRVSENGPSCRNSWFFVRPSCIEIMITCGFCGAVECGWMSLENKQAPNVNNNCEFVCF